MAENILKELKDLFTKKAKIAKANGTDELYILFYEEEGGVSGYSLNSNEFTSFIKKKYFNTYNSLVNQSNIEQFKELIRVKYCDITNRINIAKRVFNNGEAYAYEINKDDNTQVIIENGEAFLGFETTVVFKHSVDYANQVTPDLEADPNELFGFMQKYFRMKEQDLKLLTLYLVSAFYGLDIAHPILTLSGAKGSAKSTSFRVLEKLIDPKGSDLFAIPKTIDALHLRLSNSYYVCLDNLSSINREVSDILARSVTGGSVCKRALYSNSDEVVMDITALVAINGVNLVARESDLLDRLLLVTTERIKPEEMVTEEEFWSEFEKDRARILGCCFNVLAKALNDTVPVEVERMIRLSDYHILCIRIGRALGWSEEEVNTLLWKNQQEVDRKTIDEDIVAIAVVELMDVMMPEKIYINSVSGLLGDLQDVLSYNSINPYLLPKLPNHLSNRLSKVASSLKAEYGIEYVIKNTGAFKEITIFKK